ncbi:glyoxalase [Rhodobacterales bacterium HKCCE2091]|nr:glyoxalase [Rhodobacterales bacterium HKCCE2091]
MAQIVHAVGHVKLNTDCLADVVRDSTEILGLHVTHDSAEQVWLSSNGRKAEVVFLAAAENATHTIGLETLTAEGVETAAARVDAAGCRVLSETPSLDCMDAGVTFATPEGLRFEIHTPIRDDIHRPRRATNGVGPRRMDHMNLLSPDPQATVRQLEAIGDVRMSEKMVNDGLTWLYGGNRQHHILGIVKSHAAGLHHYSFEFPDFSMYCRLGDILDLHDRQLIWGPGRHRPGDNTFAYYLDSSGAMVECAGPMSMIADDAHFEPNIITNLERPGNVRVMNVWGDPAPLPWREHFFPFTALD